MPLMIVLMIFELVYFSSLAIMIVYQKQINSKYAIAMFTGINILFYFFEWLYYFKTGQFRFLVFEQISPCMFTMLSLSYFMKEKIRHAFYCAAAFLSMGMFLAMIISPGMAYLSGYTDDMLMHHAIGILEHLNLSLFGTYLLLSETVKLNLKNLKRGMLFLFSIIGFGIIVNFIFHQNFFGMGYYRNFRIYGVRFFDSYWITLLGYLLGVCFVFLLGYEWGYMLIKQNKRNAKTVTDAEITKTEKAEEESLDSEKQSLTGEVKK